MGFATHYSDQSIALSTAETPEETQSKMKTIGLVLLLTLLLQEISCCNKRQPNLSDELAKLGLDQETLNDLSDKFRDKGAELLEYMKNSPEKLQGFLSNNGLTGEGINNFASKVQNAVTGGCERAHLAFGLITTILVIFHI